MGFQEQTATEHVAFRFVTHLYTVLVGGTVIPGGGEPDVSAICWAGDTVLALGTDDEVRGISRGDSHLVDLEGAFVVPFGDVLEVGGPADLVVLSEDPRAAGGPTGSGPPAVAVVRGGRVVEGALPGAPPHGDHGDHGDHHHSD